MKATEEISLDVHGDSRGSLIAIEHGGVRNIPFDIKRVYYIFNTVTGINRGLHAHRKTEQLLVAVNGSCRILVDDGKERNFHILSDPSQALLIRKMVWREMMDFSPDCVLLVIASENYAEEDYIRDYAEFQNAVNKS